MKDFEEWEFGHPLDITELVDIEVKCNDAYFFRPFLSGYSVEESIKKIEDKIEILEYILSENFNKFEITKVCRNSESDEELDKNLKCKLKLPIKIINYILGLGIREFSNLGSDNDIHKLKTIQLFLKHIKNYQKELKEIE